MLVGRDGEIRLIVAMLDAIEQAGGALVIHGEPGIGKSALLADAARRATGRGIQILAATGVQSEADLPFAGLHQLLRPILAGLDTLAPHQRAAVHAAFGAAEGPAPELFQIALAVLDLLAESAAQTPILVIAEDAHWLDHATCDVLAFVARRLQSDPIVLLAASREESDSLLARAGLPELALGALDDATAGALVDALGPGLEPALRERLLAEAAGNPLALVELPIPVAEMGGPRSCRSGCP